MDFSCQTSNWKRSEFEVTENHFIRECVMKEIYILGIEKASVRRKKGKTFFVIKVITIAQFPFLRVWFLRGWSVNYSNEFFFVFISFPILEKKKKQK